MIFGVGGTLVFLDYFLFRNIGFEIGGFSSLVAGSSIFGARASTNEEIDRIYNLSRRSQGRDRGGERDIGKVS